MKYTTYVCKHELTEKVFEVKAKNIKQAWVMNPYCSEIKIKTR